jgi:tRNA G10  N-methylase Trm11
VFLYKSNDKIYYGKATEEYDYKEQKNRDMKKPVRREHLAISPRLSIILINLSGAKPGDHLLDPFCGIGAIMAEAILKKIKVYGIDVNSKAINDAKKNLKWLEKEYEINTKYTLENIDSKKTPDMQFSAIATETPLGKVLRKKPSNSEAKKIIQDFEAFIIPILKRLKSSKKQNAKIAITFPKIRKMGVNSRKIAEKTNLKILTGPIEESRPDQFISREILVFK